MPSKDIMSLVARRWSQVGEQEKRAWQFKAEQLKQAAAAEAAATTVSNVHNDVPHESFIEEIGLPEPPSADGGSDDWGGTYHGSRKKPARNKFSSTTATSSTVI